MNPYIRTTITVPADIYRKSRVRAASENKSLSRFIADLLRKYIPEERKEVPSLPLGKYRLKGPARFRREDIYDPYLRRKVPSRL